MSTETAIPATTQSFSAAYQSLKAAADRIEAAAEDDLDTVIELVEQAKRAKEVCDERLRATTERLQQLLE